MINHAFEPEPFERDACDRKFDDDGRAGYCGRPKAEHLAATILAPREGEPGDAETYTETKPREPGCLCHKEEGDSPCPIHGEEKATVFRLKWPRRIGWKKLQERRKACRHAFGKGACGESIIFAADKCPRCLADEVAYWKARSRSAEGNAARETVRALRLEAGIAVERSRVGTLDALRIHLRKMVDLADYHVNEIEGIAENDSTPENITRAQLARTNLAEAEALAAPAADPTRILLPGLRRGAAPAAEKPAQAEELPL